MAHAYQYHGIENFPVSATLGNTWQTVTQLALPLPNGDDEAHSKIKFVGQSDYSDYSKYFVRHEIVEQRKVRFAQEDRNQVIFIEEFHLYIPPNATYLLAETTSRSSGELLKRIRASAHDFSYTVRSVNLFDLRQKLRGHVRGGWFKELDIADVSTAAIFGANVGDSEEWQRYEGAGTLSALVLEFRHRGITHSVNISSHGSITLYSNYSEKDALELVEFINDIVMKFSEESSPIKPRKHSKQKE
jgi:hypothetical protein